MEGRPDRSLARPLHRGSDSGTPAVLTDWGKKQFDLFDGKMDPCLPVGVTRQINAPDPIQIVQTKDRVVILYESWHIFRSIPTDGRDHPSRISIPPGSEIQ